jgi:hypothetical protein
MPAPVRSIKRRSLGSICRADHSAIQVVGSHHSRFPMLVAVPYGNRERSRGERVAIYGVPHVVQLVERGVWTSLLQVRVLPCISDTTNYSSTDSHTTDTGP